MQALYFARTSSFARRLDDVFTRAKQSFAKGPLEERKSRKRTFPFLFLSFFSFFLSSVSFLPFLHSTPRPNTHPSLDPDHRGNGREERTPDLGRTPNHQRERTPSSLFFFFTESTYLSVSRFLPKKNSLSHHSRGNGGLQIGQR